MRLGGRKCPNVFPTVSVGSVVGAAKNCRRALRKRSPYGTKKGAPEMSRGRIVTLEVSTEQTARNL